MSTRAEFVSCGGLRMRHTHTQLVARQPTVWTLNGLTNDIGSLISLSLFLSLSLSLSLCLSPSLSLSLSIYLSIYPSIYSQSSFALLCLSERRLDYYVEQAYVLRNKLNLNLGRIHSVEEPLSNHLPVTTIFCIPNWWVVRSLHLRSGLSFPSSLG